MPADSPPAAAETPDKVTKPDWRSLNGVLLVQSQNVLNDKITQFILIGLAGVVVAGMAPGSWTYDVLKNYDLFIALPMSLPFVLFAPLSGWLSDRFSKRTVILWCLILQVVVLAWIAMGLRMEAIWLTSTGFFFLALQSTLLSPAKMGICKELVGSEKLAVAAGLMQMLTIICIIIGSVIGGQVFSALDKSLEDPWKAALIIVGALLALSFAPFLVMLIVRKPPAPAAEPFRPALLVEHFSHLKDLFRERSLRLAGIGDTFFWFAGGAIVLILISAGKEAYPGGDSTAIQVSGYFNGAVGAGIALGSVVVSMLCRRRNELGLIPIGALGMAISMGMIFFQPPNTWHYYVNLFFMGAFSAAYVVPLNALIQDLPAPDRRGRVLSAVNLLNSLAGLLAIAFVLGMRMTGLDTRYHFLVLGVLALGAGIFILQLMPHHFMRFVVLWLTNRVYRIKALNLDRIPKEGGVLMISNHVSYIDAFIISAACPRPVRFVILSKYMRVRPIAWFLRLFNAIPISPSRAKDAIRTTAEAVADGSVVCIFPEGRLTKTGMMNELKKGFELIARQAKSPVLPVYMDALWGSIFSYERQKYFYKAPKRFPYPVTVNFGDPIRHGEVTSALARAEIQDLSTEAFAERAELKRTLAAHAIRALKRKPGRPVFVEIGKQRRVLTRGVVLATAAGLAKRWRASWPDERRRVGVLLPPGSMAALMNVALVLAGRTPVNLPLEIAGMDDARRQQLLEEHGIDGVITSVALFPGRELPEGHFDMTSEIVRVSAPSRILGRAGAYFEPARLAVRRLRAREADPANEAVAYLTKLDNGGFGLISLTHRNVLASVYQIDSSTAIPPNEAIFVEAGFEQLPALLLGLWHPLLNRGVVVYRGLAARQIPVLTILEEEEPEVVLLTDGLMAELTSSSQAPPKGIRAMLGFGPEPPAAGVLAKLEQGGADFRQGFGPNSLGAIATLSTPDTLSARPADAEEDDEAEFGRAPGTFGRLLPGVSGRIVDGSGQVTGLHETGQLLVRGPAFPPPNRPGAVVEIDGEIWIATGLRGHFDLKGFFHPADGHAVKGDR